MASNCPLGAWKRQQGTAGKVGSGQSNHDHLNLQEEVLGILSDCWQLDSNFPSHYYSDLREGGDESPWASGSHGKLLIVNSWQPMKMWLNPGQKESPETAAGRAEFGLWRKLLQGWLQPELSELLV